VRGSGPPPPAEVTMILWADAPPALLAAIDLGGARLDHAGDDRAPRARRSVRRSARWISPRPPRPGPWSPFRWRGLACPAPPSSKTSPRRSACPARLRRRASTASAPPSPIRRQSPPLHSFGALSVAALTGLPHAATGMRACPRVLQAGAAVGRYERSRGIRRSPRPHRADAAPKGGSCMSCRARTRPRAWRRSSPPIRPARRSRWGTRLTIRRCRPPPTSPPSSPIPPARHPSRQLPRWCMSAARPRRADWAWADTPDNPGLAPH